MHLEGPYILLAEDDADDQEMFVSRFRRVLPDWDVLCCHDGREALLYLEHWEVAYLPRLILLDFHMPMVPGFEVLQVVKTHPVLRQIPTMIWSSFDNPADIERCLKCGALEYLVKPDRMQGLDNIVNRVISYLPEIRASFTG